MKFVIRRAVASAILAPVIAGAYVLGCAVLIGLGAGAGFTSAEAWSNGWLVAIAFAIVFTLSTQLNKVLDKVGA